MAYITLDVGLMVVKLSVQTQLSGHCSVLSKVEPKVFHVDKNMADLVSPEGNYST